MKGPANLPEQCPIKVEDSMYPIQNEISSQIQAQQPNVVPLDFKVISRTINGGNQAIIPQNQEFPNPQIDQLQEMCSQPNPLLLISQSQQDQIGWFGNKILVMEGEIPLSIECFRMWKRVAGYEKKIDGNLYEFTLQDLQQERLTFEEANLFIQSQTQLQLPALQVFISQFQLIHAKRGSRREQAKRGYSHQAVFQDFIIEFQKQFLRRTDKAIKSLIEPHNPHNFSASNKIGAAQAGYVATLRCKWNIDLHRHEFYKLGFSKMLIHLLGTDPDSLCYDFMKNGIRNFLDEESLLNISSILICYHMTKCLLERRSITIKIKTYDGLIIPASCTIQFHAEKMDSQNSYFESIVTLSLAIDQQVFPQITQIRQQQQQTLQIQQQQTIQQRQAPQNQSQFYYDPSQDQPSSHNSMPHHHHHHLHQMKEQSEDKYLEHDPTQMNKPNAYLDDQSIENNKLILQKFYGFSFESGNRSSKSGKVKRN